MATLRTVIRGEPITVEMTIDELQRLLELRSLSLRGRQRANRSVASFTRPTDASKSVTAATASEALAAAIKRVWPGGIELVDDPELTTGNVRRFLIQRVLNDAFVVSTAEVAQRFFGRQLETNDPEDAANLRRLWYCIREAKRDIQEAIRGHWEDATDIRLRAGASRSWRFVQWPQETTGAQTVTYREQR